MLPGLSYGGRCLAAQYGWPSAERETPRTASPEALRAQRAVLRGMSDAQLATLARDDDEAGRMARRMLLGRTRREAIS